MLWLSLQYQHRYKPGWMARGGEHGQTVQAHQVE